MLSTPTNQAPTMQSALSWKTDISEAETQRENNLYQIKSWSDILE